MSHIVIEVWLYGECARYGNKINLEGVANLKVKLLEGSTLQDLLDYLLICAQEFDIVLVNGKVHATPARQLDLTQPLGDGTRFDFLDSQNLRSSKFRTARHWLLNRSLRSDPARIELASLIEE